MWNKISSNSVKFVRLVDEGEKNDGVQAGARGGGGGGCSEEGAGGREEVVVASWHEEGCGNGGRSRGSVLAREAFYLATGIRQYTSAYVSIRQHTSAYVSIRQRAGAREAFYLATGGELPPAAYADVC